MNRPKRIAIIGSTGSIGTQTLQVVSAHPDLLTAEILTAGSNADLLIRQAGQYKPNAVVIADRAKYAEVRDALQHLPIKVFAGEESIAQIVTSGEIDAVVTAVVGFAGLQPTLNAIKARKQIALANKETLVVAGRLVTQLAAEYRVPILPVDSEHSAIFQCLEGEDPDAIEKIILTGSGGPFRTFTAGQMAGVTKAQALHHPSWTMGAKITIDSATLMNKGFEVIEARWLFAASPEQVEVVIHPQSVIHSMVQFRDGAVKAQLGLPDMRLPIQYALTYPVRRPMDLPRLDFSVCQSLTFEQPDLQKFRCLALAYRALREGGNRACALNAANETAVRAFLEDRIAFNDIARINETVMDKAAFIAEPTVDDLLATHREAGRMAGEMAGMAEHKSII
ncbi:MAG: 1-deoxy-D-xylulose-5-phosphate reductoisomerase [Bacteroidales bacterium]|nr:1-deoxy-D-xylulose-5-phosphate reductoisomerase [Bacteroidales bacterium]